MVSASTEEEAFERTARTAWVAKNHLSLIISISHFPFNSWWRVQRIGPIGRIVPILGQMATEK